MIWNKVLQYYIAMQNGKGLPTSELQLVTFHGDFHGCSLCRYLFLPV